MIICIIMSYIYIPKFYTFKIFLNFLFFLIKVSIQCKDMINSKSERLNKFLIGYYMIVISVWNEYFMSFDLDIKHTNLVNLIINK